MIRKILIENSLGLTAMAVSLLLFVNVRFLSFQNQDSAKDFIAPPPKLEQYTVGLRYQIADLIWIRALQDFDFCEKQLDERTCQGKSWLFEMIDTVVRLDSHFKNPYMFGGLALTVLISDYAGASIIFDKAVEKFPNDWNLNYIAAYHSLFEEKNQFKAAQRFEAAARGGAPSWVYVRASRLYDESGKKELAQDILNQLEKSGQHPALVNRLKEKLNSNE